MDNWNEPTGKWQEAPLPQLSFLDVDFGASLGLLSRRAASVLARFSSKETPVISKSFR